MASFIEKLLSGQYPKLESLWTKEFERLVDEIFSRIDLPEDLDDEPAGLDSDFDESPVESDLNHEIKCLRDDVADLERELDEERSRHEAAKRELQVVKAELKAARYKLGAIQAAMSTKFHPEPIG